MTIISIDDQLINEIISVSHYQNAQEAVVKILANYLRQQKTRSNIAELLAMPNAAEIDFDSPRSTMAFHPADLS